MASRRAAWPGEPLLQLAHELPATLVGEFILADEVDVRAHDSVEHEVARQPRVGLRSIRAQDDVRLESETPSGGSRRTAMVGLDAADGDDRVAALGQRLSEEEFQLSHLVPAQFAPRDVVTLDPDLTLCPIDARELPIVQRRRQRSEMHP